MTLDINSIIREKRVLAYLLDAMITMFVGIALALINIIIVAIGVTNSWLPMSYAILSNQIIVMMVTLGFCFFRDMITGRSYGKKKFGISVVTINDEKPTKLQLFKKNLFMLFWFLEAFMLLTRGRTLGETLAKTKIVLEERT